jgi:hypothetical protein
MEQVTNTVTDTASNSVNIVKGVKDDIIQLDFYKNPIFIVFSLYIIVIFGIYFNMDNDTKNNYIFTNKFRDSGGIHWLNIISYPYKFGGNALLFSPIMIYLLVGLLLTINVIDPLQSRNQAYFYSLMFSFLFIMVIFVFHMIIFHYIIDTKKTTIELKLGDPDNVEKTYTGFYRTQWVILFALSPILITCLVYAVRKLGKT